MIRLLIRTAERLGRSVRRLILFFCQQPSLLVSTCALALSIVTFYSNTVQTAQLSLAMLDYRDSYDSQKDVLTITMSVAAANYGNTNVLFGELSLDGFDEPGSPAPVLTSNVPRIVPKSDVSLITVNAEFSKEARTAIYARVKSADPLKVLWNMMMDLIFVDSEGVYIWRRNALLGIYVEALNRSPEKPLPMAGTSKEVHPTFGFACLYIRNILESSDCFQTFSMTEGTSRPFRPTR